MNRSLSDFISKGGRLLDPATGPEALLDVHICDGKVSAIGSDLDSEGATTMMSKVVSSHRD